MQNLWVLQKMGFLPKCPTIRVVWYAFFFCKKKSILRILSQAFDLGGGIDPLYPLPWIRMKTLYYDWWEKIICETERITNVKKKKTYMRKRKNHKQVSGRGISEREREWAFLIYIMINLKKVVLKNLITLYSRNNIGGY